MPFNKAFVNLGLAGNMAELATLASIILILSIVFCFVISRYRLHNCLINIYISMALVSVIPQDIMLFMKNSYVIVFVLLIVVLTLMNKYLFDIYQSGPSYALWKSFILSFLEVTLILSVIFSNLASKDIPNFVSHNSMTYFIDPWWRFLWATLPLIFLILLKKRQ
ncbi:MAG TPA: hypothetical protein PLB52_04180 [Candidatus Moranbacteria bacterium]|mgnify:CR=1 FL=1|nr:hypothetical protein [Candidatus Moranbacteria bacterium]